MRHYVAYVASFGPETRTCPQGRLQQRGRMEEDYEALFSVAEHPERTPQGGGQVAPRNAGFAACRWRYLKMSGPGGQSTCQAVVAILPDGGLEGCGFDVCWQLRDFYYRLGFAEGQELDDYLRRSQDRMKTVLDYFTVPENHLCPSRRMYTSACSKDAKAIDDERLTKDFTLRSCARALG